MVARSTGWTICCVQALPAAYQRPPQPGRIRFSRNTIIGAMAIFTAIARYGRLRIFSSFKHDSHVAAIVTICFGLKTVPLITATRTGEGGFARSEVSVCPELRLA
jgi:hypothetical protein